MLAVPNALHNATGALTEYFKREAQNIVSSVSEAYPENAILLKRALKAHQKKDYAVSVMLFLSQADSIGSRHFQWSPYTRRQKSKDSLKATLSRRPDDLLLRANWELLGEDLPLTRSCKGGPPPSGVLNRHAVMHGLSLDYGTEVNSARALSWLAYIADVKDWFAEHFAQMSASGDTAS